MASCRRSAGRLLCSEDDEEEQDGTSDIPQSFLDAISEATG